MDTGVVFNQVAILFFIMIVGFYAKKKKYINAEVSKKLSEILLNITLPLMIINSFQFEFSKEKLYSAGLVLIISLSIHLVSALMAMVIFKRFNDSEKKVLKFSTTFSNCAFMGFPVLLSIYGQEGVFYGSIYTISFNLFLWTYGVMVFSGKKDFGSIKTALINPGTIAVYIGLITFIFSIKLPYILNKSFDMVGSMTVPISMIIIGALLADIEFKTMFSGIQMYIVTVIRLVIIPVIVLVILRFFGVTGLVLGVNVACAGMPVAATTAIFAQKYEGDAPLASRIVAFSTIVSLVSIPLIILMI